MCRAVLMLALLGLCACEDDAGQATSDIGGARLIGGTLLGSGDSASTTDTPSSAGTEAVGTVPEGTDAGGGDEGGDVGGRTQGSSDDAESGAGGAAGAAHAAAAGEIGAGEIGAGGDGGGDAPMAGAEDSGGSSEPGGPTIEEEPGIPCGGRSNVQCPQNLICDLSGNLMCGAALEGVCIVDEPVQCTRESRPVCGCDQVSYDNDCRRRAGRAALHHEGRCESASVVGVFCGGANDLRCAPGQFCDLSGHLMCGDDLRGVCTREMPTRCPIDVREVCGCDGVTYANDCFRQAAGAALDHTGRCDGDVSTGVSCGPTSAMPCPRGQVCDLSRNRMCGVNLRGECVADRPIACTNETAPVCGCDGETYSNDCMRRGARVALDHTGPCDGDPSSVGGCGGATRIRCPQDLVCDLSDNTMCTADMLGTCVEEAQVFCTAESRPVCGCDGVTYPNDCLRRGAYAALDREGECGDEPDPPVTADMCGGVADQQCAADEFCDLSENEVCGDDLGGYCKPDEARPCNALEEPVCGCDSETYRNHCFRRASGAALDHEGECEEPPVEEGMCGGVEGRACPDRQLCDLSENEMCGAGLVGTCRPDEPRACTSLEEPVCGCDGETYRSNCFRRAFGVALDHEGQCEAPEPPGEGDACGGIAGLACPSGMVCDLSENTACGESEADLIGVCIVPELQDCVIFEEEPVCGCDGVTYPHDCVRQVAYAALDHEGECEAPALEPGMCGGAEGRTCDVGELCDLGAREMCGDDLVGFCRPQAATPCSTLADPVCGCDGETYTNHCFRRAFGIALDHEGACDAPGAGGDDGADAASAGDDGADAASAGNDGAGGASAGGDDGEVSAGNHDGAGGASVGGGEEGAGVESAGSGGGAGAASGGGEDDGAGAASAGDDDAGTASAGDDDAGAASAGDDDAGAASAGDDDAGAPSAGDEGAGGAGG